MRRWLPRAFWLAAWSLWAWLGWGLYRELPRDLGPPLCVLPLNLKTSRIVGWNDDTNHIALAVDDGLRHPTIDVYDGATGKLLYSKPGAKLRSYIASVSQSRGCRAPFAIELSNGTETTAEGVHRFDLETGEWQRLSNRPCNHAVVHPMKPLVAYEEYEITTQGLSQITLLNWETKQAIVVRRLGTELSLASSMFFLQKPDRLATPLAPRIQMYRDPPSGFVELWNLTDSPTLGTRIDQPVLGRPSSSLDGRITFSHPGRIDVIDVFDLNTGRRLFTNMPPEERPAPNRNTSDYFDRPILARSGLRVLGGQPPTLWDVDTGAVVWQSQGMTVRGESSNTILVLESWSRLWKSWLPKFKYDTRAYHNLETGRLIFRTPGTVILSLDYWNAAGTRAVGNNGGVYVLPPPPNWLLLALCQTILVLPIVFTWLALRWRRKRRLRLAGAA